MASRVLVPLDGSPQAWAALEHVLGEYPDARLTALTVINPIEAGHSAETALPSAAEAWYQSAREAAERRFDEAAELAAERGTAFDTAIEVGRPTRVIVEYAEEHGVDHVVMGSHGRTGVSRFLLGSVAEAVVRRSPVPVTVVR
jgi:nucleotide-binding universal stress UspA family protein